MKSLLPDADVVFELIKFPKNPLRTSHRPAFSGMMAIIRLAAYATLRSLLARPVGRNKYTFKRT